MSTRNILFLLLLLLLPFHLSAGNTDSIVSLKKNNTTRVFTVNQFEFLDSSRYIDNTLYNFQNYLGRAHLGNNGLAFNSLHFQPMPAAIGFNYFKNNFENYFYTSKKLKFYNTRTPYTDLFYVIGNKREQLFKMTFSYNIKKNWNVSVDFSRIRSEGFYQRQSTNNNFIAVSSNFRSGNNRYWFLAGVFYNNVKNNENGGIADDSVFENAGVIDKKLIDINLTSAKRKTINRSIYFKQYLNFGRRSADTASHNMITPESRLILTSVFDDNILVYEDGNPLSGFYTDIYYDSTKTFDSTYSFKIENELAWKRTDNKKRRGLKDMLGVGVNVKHQLINVRQYEIDTALNNIIAGAEFYNTYSNHKLWWNIGAKYTLEGYNAEDYSASATIKKEVIDSLSSLSLKIESRQQAPDFIYHRFSSNHFKWNNSFEKIQESGATINLSISKYDMDIGVDFRGYTNVLYFDTNAIAKQYKGSIGILSATFKKDFTFHNWHFNNHIRYQLAPDSIVIRIPEFVSEHSLYYENEVLKGAMRLQIGASVFYTSEYYANAYMPATAQFYLQDNKRYGGYPFIDFFINAQIKTVRIFIKIDHLNSGWMENRSMLTANYPMNDRAFKLGVSWRFFN
ncbi:MAG: putative porin [Bacteroidota bacterium]